nr:unnamed protein product [Callosobruchus chinensis]
MYLLLSTKKLSSILAAKRLDFTFDQDTQVHICKKCGRKYKYRKNVLTHIKYECSTPKQFQCKECGKLFSQQRYLRYHLSSRHGVLKNRF